MCAVIWLIRALTPRELPLVHLQIFTNTAMAASGRGGSGLAAPAIATMAYSEKTSDSQLEKFGGAAANAVIFIFFVTLMTFVFVFLIKYRCYKIIYGWLTFSVLSLLGMLGGVVFFKLLQDGPNLSPKLTQALTVETCLQ